MNKHLKYRIRHTGALFWASVFCLFYSYQGHSQSPFNANWVFGLGFGEKGAILDFNSTPPSAKTIDTSVMNIFSSNLSMSNEEGELIFYSNGCYLANAQHRMILNSEDLTPGFTVDAECPFGSSFSESQIAIPSINEANTYYLFQLINQQRIEPLSDPGAWAFAPLDLVYSKIDMNLENGLGALTEKHVSILSDTFSNNGFQAIKHANGEDWWLVVPEYASNCYYTILFAADTFQIQSKQCLGYEWGFIDMGNQSAVSLDGTQYARYTTKMGVTLLEFDRCTGRFNNSKHFAENIVPDRVGGVAFSPNARYLYVTTLLELYQFDLQAPDIEASKTLIAEYDGTTNPTAANFFRGATGNDGKLYWCTWRNTYNLHVINAPNEPGLACDFVHSGIDLPEMNDGGIPSFPNYSLGPSSEPCESTATTECQGDCQQEDFYLYPNPTQGSITVAGKVKDNYQLILYDLLGREAYQHKISEERQEIQLPSTLSSGVYIYKIMDSEKPIHLDKLYLQ